MIDLFVSVSDWVKTVGTKVKTGRILHVRIDLTDKQLEVLILCLEAGIDAAVDPKEDWGIAMRDYYSVEKLLGKLRKVK